MGWTADGPERGRRRRRERRGPQRRGEGRVDGGHARGDWWQAADRRWHRRNQHVGHDRRDQAGQAVWRRRRPHRNALLREAVAGRAAPALHADCRRGRAADRALQRAGPDRRRHVGRDDRRALAPPDDPGAQGRHRRQRALRADARHLRRRVPSLLRGGRDGARVCRRALPGAASSLPRRSPRQRSRAPSPPPPIPRRRPSSRRAAGTCCKEETASSRSLPTSRPPLSHGSWPRQTHATPAPPRPPTRR